MTTPAAEPPDRTFYDATRARRYDARHAEQLDELDTTVGTLARLAAGRPVLELGVGTGRLGVPLAAGGLDVTGVDLSADMLAQLAAKPGGERVRPVRHDFTEVDAVLPAHGFGLVYLAYSTLFELTTQEQQVRCFAAAAALLQPGGVFVVEALVPEHTGPAEGLAAGRTVYMRHVGADGVTVRELVHDQFHQQLRGHDVTLSPKGFEYAPFLVRYARPPELELMARLAGLRLRELWADWAGAPFTETSERFVAVYETPAG